MHKHTRSWLLAGLLGLLVACGGGGGGNSAQGVDPGPPPPGGAVPPPQPEIPETNPSPYAEAEELFAFITDVALNGDNQAVVQFQLTDGKNVPIIDLTVDNLRFVISKLEGSPLGNLTGTWQSYINKIDIPEVDIGIDPRLQATTENNGEFTNNGDGTYTYRYATSLTDLPQDILDQAAAEGLNLDFEPDRTHRVAIQFDGAPSTANPNYDWVPTSGATDGIFHMDIAATDNCNLCHDPLGIHNSGRRREIKYCVTCHNTGTTDADSTNTVDFKVMIHKIHRGANLPSVEAGGRYVIYGGSGTPHDYSNLQYPQDIRNCVNCHVGTGTDPGGTDLVLTDQGDNWAQYPARAACGSCHDDLDFANHKGGQTDDSKCASCHSLDGIFESVEDSHRMLVAESMDDFEAKVLSVRNSAPGQIPVVTFKVTNTSTGEAYDIFNDPVWTQSDSALNIKVGWDTGDYTNTGNEGDNASTISSNALTDAIDNGDGSYRISAPLAIPNGSKQPGIAASGSGVATVEGHPAVDLEGDGIFVTVPLNNAAGFFSINESNGQASPRRQSVDLNNCLTCHGDLILHGSNRNNNIDSCVSCHNPRNTDLRVREIAANPPTDGKREESIHFKTMIHGIHAAGMREEALQIVGFGGFSTHVYDEDTVRYPGNLANCVACHTDDGYTLPLVSSALGTSVDTGSNIQNPNDDTVVTPITATCSSCHDDTVAAAHMTSNGGSFSTTQGAIDDGEVVEECTICHGAGNIADVAEVHDIP